MSHVHGDYEGNDEKPKLDDVLLWAVAQVFVADKAFRVRVRRFFVWTEVIRMIYAANTGAVIDFRLVSIWLKKILKIKIKDKMFVLHFLITFEQIDVIPRDFSALLKAGQSCKESINFQLLLTSFILKPLQSNICQSCIALAFCSRSCSRRVQSLDLKKKS